MSLSLCMIVKDEEDNLPRCLESIKDIVDEMIIVDTGSKDSTVEIADSYGAKVYHYKWEGNFSAARNYSLQFASGDWILLMDADDELDSSQKHEVLGLLKDDSVEAYFFETISYLGDAPGVDIMKNLNARLIRNGRGYYFSNPIHEQIWSNIQRITPSAKIVTKEIKVYHYGYISKNIAGHQKRDRNISILEQEMKSSANMGFTLFNLGNEYMAKGENSKAIEYYEKSYDVFDPPQGYSSKLVLKMVTCYYSLGQYDKAFRIIDTGLAHYPEFTDLEHMRGVIYNKMGNSWLALKSFKKCVRMGESPAYYNVMIGSGTYKAYSLMGEIYRDFEDYDEAEECFRKALELNALYTPALTQLIKVLCQKDNTDEKLLKRIEKLRKINPDKFDDAVLEALIQERQYQFALVFAEKYEKAFGISSYSQYIKGVCTIHLKRFAETFDIMDSLRKDPEYRERAVCLQVLCRILENKGLQAAELLNSSVLDQDAPLVKVHKAFCDIINKGKADILSDVEKESWIYTIGIFDLLEIILTVQEFDLFEKALNLLNLISDKSVLCKLGKLYYNSRFYTSAYKEFLRSIGSFGQIDPEGAYMLYRLKLKGFTLV
ncbi:MAG TPA: glycosyltransferase [Clostridia bacterium]|nr:glycosyltransferase [Clostridia bacterium]